MFIIVVIGIVVIVVIALLVFKARSGSDEGITGQAAYEKSAALFTNAERSFLGVLDQAIGQHYRIMGKIRLADVIKVKANPDKSAWQRAFNQIQSKHVDFAACDPATLQVKFVIELDDSSHDQAKRQERDQFVDKALRSAGVPMHRFEARRTYSMQEIQKALLPAAAPGARATAEALKQPAKTAVGK